MRVICTIDLWPDAEIGPATPDYEFTAPMPFAAPPEPLWWEDDWWLGFD